MIDLSPPHIKNPININPWTVNFQSECLFHYKRTIIQTIISRANLLSSSRTIFLNELRNIKQTLINNRFPNYIVDTKIKQFINKPEQPNIDNSLNHKQSINLYYKNQFHSNYKIDEQIFKNLIHKNVPPTHATKKVRLIYIYIYIYIERERERLPRDTYIYMNADEIVSLRLKQDEAISLLSSKSLI